MFALLVIYVTCSCHIHASHWNVCCVFTDSLKYTPVLKSECRGKFRFGVIDRECSWLLAHCPAAIGGNEATDWQLWTVWAIDLLLLITVTCKGREEFVALNCVTRFVRERELMMRCPELCVAISGSADGNFKGRKQFGSPASLTVTWRDEKKLSAFSCTNRIPFYRLLCITVQQSLWQARPAFRVLRAVSAEFGLRRRDTKFSTQNEEWMCILWYITLPVYSPVQHEH